MTALSLTQRWLKDNIGAYGNQNKVYADVDSALSRFASLRPKTDVYTYDDGRSQLMLCIHGLLPVTFRQAAYNIPVSLWLPYDYPRSPPISFVTPTSDMMVKASRFLDPSGLCKLEYTQNWHRKSEGCSLIGQLEAMQDQFSRDSPLYMKPKAQIRQDGLSKPSSPSPMITNMNPSPPMQPNGPPTLPPKPGAGPSTHTSPPMPQPSPRPSSQEFMSPPPVPPRVYPSNAFNALNGAHNERERYPSSYMSPPPTVRADLSYGATIPSTSTVHLDYSPPLRPPPPPSRALPDARHSSIISASYHPDAPSPAYQSVAPLSPPPLSSGPSHLYSTPSLTAALSSPPSNLLDDDVDGSPLMLGPQTQQLPPRPPNPELLRLHAQVHSMFRIELDKLDQATRSHSERARALQNDLLAGEPAIRDEMARLDAVRDVCTTVASRYRAVVDAVEANVLQLRQKGDPDVDELVCSTTIVHNQLLNLIAEDHAIEDTIYHLHRALGSGRIDLERFLRTTRVLAEEQFTKRALIDKIIADVPIGSFSSWT